MSGANATGRNRLARIQRYRRLMYGSILVGVGGFVAAEELGYPFVGLAVYWAGILGFVGIWKGTSVELFDERDAALERRASYVTFQIAAVVGILTMTSLVVVANTPDVAVSDHVWGGFLALSALFILYGVVYTVIRHRR